MPARINQPKISNMLVTVGRGGAVGRGSARAAGLDSRCPLMTPRAAARAEPRPTAPREPDNEFENDLVAVTPLHQQ